MIVAIDPDTKKCGVAMFSDKRALELASAMTLAELVRHLAGVSVVVCEMPQTYGGRAAKGDTNDLLAVMRVVGQIEHAANLASARFVAVLPTKWKGTAPKHVTIRRAWNTLELRERFRVMAPKRGRTLLETGRSVASGETADVMDAVGLGLWYVGRLHEKLGRELRK